MKEISQYEKLKNLIIEMFELRNMIESEKVEKNPVAKKFLGIGQYQVDAYMVSFVGQIIELSNSWHEFGEWEAIIKNSVEEITIASDISNKCGGSLFIAAVDRFNVLPEEIKSKYWDSKATLATINNTENFINKSKFSISDVLVD